MINFKIASFKDATFSISVPELSLEFINELRKLDFKHTSFIVCRSEGDHHEFKRCVYACELIRRSCPDSFIVVVDKQILQDDPKTDLFCERRSLKKEIDKINARLKAIAEEV